MDDRQVHARGADGVEVVRYGKAGKYYLERPDGTRSWLKLVEAATWGAHWLLTGTGQVFWGTYGGSAYDRAVRKAQANPELARA